MKGVRCWTMSDEETSDGGSTRHCSLVAGGLSHLAIQFSSSDLGPEAKVPGNR